MNTVITTLVPTFGPNLAPTLAPSVPPTPPAAGHPRIPALLRPNPALQDAWIATFAQHLMLHCPRLETADAEHVGDGLWRESRWRNLEPTLAAERWMVQVLGVQPGHKARSPQRMQAANAPSCAEGGSASANAAHSVVATCWAGGVDWQAAP